MSKLPDKYDAKIVENKWREQWQKQQIYKWHNDLPKAQTFVIDTPPPTVSGLLHMGHVFSYTQADFVARYNRMSGKDVFYPMGFDDNGLPTERLVEKIIGKKAMVYEAEQIEKNGGVKNNSGGYFVEKCREVVAEAEAEFEALFNEIALSVDWDQKYQTISPEAQKISQASFIDLFNKGLVEKRHSPVFWDISDRTALAKADIIDTDLEGEMFYFNFAIEGGIEDGAESLPIMTTRPELLPACVAVMVHPNKFKHLHGKMAITPIFGVKVKIIPDDAVLEDKGTGAVMCCTFGDETDLEWWHKYNLPKREIISENGLMKNLHHQNMSKGSGAIVASDGTFNLEENFVNSASTYLENYQEIIAGKKIKEAREAIVNFLKQNHSSIQQNQSPILIKSEKITRPVKCAERSGVPIEIISTAQWFIKILPFKEQLKQKARECNWYPEYMRVRIEQWIEGLSWDWCISRQRFFGVKFPVWHSKRKGEEGKILIAPINQLPCDPFTDLPNGYSRDEVIAETDVLDTWATSSITPQLSSKGISAEICFDKERHAKLFPADMRPQAHEIIRTWAFYTIAKSLLHEDKIPWKNLMISGWCLASDKTKMSKSKGNVVTPQALIQEKSADVVRYWASASNLGADIAYSEDVFKIGQKLITKIFNASKFCSQHFAILKNFFLEKNLSDFDDNALLQNIHETADLWILARLNQVIATYHQQFQIFEYARAREAVEEFFWKDFCDNYLEICKVRSYGLEAEKLANIVLDATQKQQILQQQISALATLYLCLKNILKLFAPFIPHITEEIYSQIFSAEFIRFKSIHARGNFINNFSLPSTKINVENILKIGDEMVKIIFEVRKYKSENNLSMKTPITILEIASELDLSTIIDDLSNVCNANKTQFTPQNFSVKIII